MGTEPDYPCSTGPGARDNFVNFVSAAIRAENVERERQMLSRTRRSEKGGPSQGSS